jgi:flagellar biogenesis protein FliO
VLAALAWGAFQIFGQYTFLIMLVIVIAALLARVGKPKFGSKK